VSIIGINCLQDWEALYYCKALLDQYPENVLYQALNIKILLLMKQYDEAEKLIIDSSEESLNQYFQAQIIIFKGILQEKKYHNNKLAQVYYQKGIRDISVFSEYGNEFAAYAYYGLSRISETNGEKKLSKTYRKEAVKLTEFARINFDK